MAGLPGAPPDGISGGSGERAADPPVGATAIEVAAELTLHLRAAANDCLARYEPLALIAAPVPALLVARTVHAAASTVADRCIAAICIAAVKLLLGVSGYNATEKKKGGYSEFSFLVLLCCLWLPLFSLGPLLTGLPLGRSEPDVIVVEYEEKNILSHPAPISGG